MSAEADRLAASLAPSVDSTPALALLPTVLSLTAGSADVISFLGLNGLFTAHITGNLVILAAHLVVGGDAPIAVLLSVPVFMVVLLLTRLLAGRLTALGRASLTPLLLLQFLLLAGSVALCVAGGPHLDPDRAIAVFGGMLGVAAMAVQNVLVQVSLTGAPTTAVMTTNITHFVVDLGELLLASDADAAAIAKARKRAKHTWPSILAFAVGCALGAGAEAAWGLAALALPAGLALVALALGVAGLREVAPRR